MVRIKCGTVGADGRQNPKERDLWRAERTTRQGAGLHFKGVTASGVPLLELTQPDAVRLQGFPSL
jgi:hypothetical protein